jgi:hypothetical protein
MKKTLVVAILIVAMILGIVAYAFAASDFETITINAKVNPKFTLSVVPAGGSFTLNWNAFTLGDPALTETVAIDIDSNRTGNLTVSWPSAPSADWHLTNTLASTTFVKKANNSYADTITFNPDYDTPSLDADSVFTLMYSAVQD